MPTIEDPFASTQSPPYFAAIFSSQLATQLDTMTAYASDWYRLATLSPGFLGAERARNSNGFGVAVTYWKTRAALDAWIDDIFNLIPEQGLAPYDTKVFSRSAMRIALITEHFLVPFDTDGVTEGDTDGDTEQGADPDASPRPVPKT